MNRLSKFIKAIKKYNLVQEGDKIAIGLSGGKDSLLLLDLFSCYKKIAKENFELLAITVDMGFDGADFSGLINFCKERDVEYKIVPSDIYKVVFEIRKEKNPCSLCAKLRRGILCSTAKENGCNKLALGHHLDDTIETFLLSLCFENRLSTFAPKSFMSQTGITVIRPMIFMYETEVIRESSGYPIFFNPCPADKHTKRQEVKEVIKNLETLCPHTKESILRAISSPERYNLWDKVDN